jgi:hypothetical protein
MGMARSSRSQTLSMWIPDSILRLVPAVIFNEAVAYYRPLAGNQSLCKEMRSDALAE